MSMLKWTKCAAALLAAAVVAGSIAGQGFAYSPKNVVISANSGGSVGGFVRKARFLKNSRAKIQFRGRCDSACTLLLALPKSQTCVAPGAYFRFHAPVSRNRQMARLAHRYMMRKYPGWVRSHIVRRGGLTGRLITINYAYASKFMRRCV